MFFSNYKQEVLGAIKTYILRKQTISLLLCQIIVLKTKKSKDFALTTTVKWEVLSYFYHEIFEMNPYLEIKFISK